MSATIVIDKRRLNSQYHYIRTSGADRTEGWGLYETWTTEEDKELWKEAVTKYNNEHNLKMISQTLVDELEKVRAYCHTVDNLQFPDLEPLVDPGLLAAINTLKETLQGKIVCDEETMNKISQSIERIPSVKSIIEYTLKATAYDAQLVLERAANSILQLGVSVFIDAALDFIETIITSVFSTIDVVWEEFNRVYSDVMRAFRKIGDITTDPEEKERIKAALKERLKSLGEEILEALYIMSFIDTFKELLQTIKNMWGARQELWASLIEKLKTLVNFDFFKDSKSNIVNLLKSSVYTLLPLVGSMAAVLLLLKILEGQYSSNAGEELDDFFKNCGFDDSRETIAQNEADKYNDSVKDTAPVWTKAVNDVDSLSLYPHKVEHKPVNSLDSGNCKISVCDFTKPVDFVEVFRDSGYLDTPKGAVVEINAGGDFAIFPAIGDNIQAGQEIANIQGASLKSIFLGHVVDKGSNYLGGYYDLPQSLQDIFDTTDADGVLSSYFENIDMSGDAGGYEKLINTVSEMGYVEAYLRDYMSFCRFPEFAQYVNTSNSYALPLSTEKFTNAYEKISMDILEAYQKDVQKISSKDNIQTAVDNGDISVIKDRLDERKFRFYDDIINNYQANPGQMPYRSAATIKDFMLYALYDEYLYGEGFDFDENNPYIMRLHDAVSDFIRARMEIELGMDNIGSLIVSFNASCEEALRTYWNDGYGTYYDRLSAMFSGKEQAYKELYNEVLEYLKTLIKYTRPEEKVTQFDDSGNVLAQIEQKTNEPSDTDDVRASQEKLRTLKRISARFISVKKVELGFRGGDNAAFVKQSDTAKKIKELSNKTIGELYLKHKEGDKYDIPLSPLYGTEDILDEYIAALKEQTAKEAVVLQQIARDAIEWYRKNDADISSGKFITDFFAQVNWPTPRTIYRNDERYDYYYFGTEGMKEGTEPPIPYNPTEEELNSDASPKTQYTQEDYMYWLRYCGMATLVGCMLTMTWPVGLNISGTNINLPVIYVPFPIMYAHGKLKVLNINNKLIIVPGMGICGVSVWPMLIFVNFSNISSTILIPIELIIGQAAKTLKDMKAQSTVAIAPIVQGAIEGCEQIINANERELQDIDRQIIEIQDMIKDKKLERELKRKAGKDVNTNAEG